MTREEEIQRNAETYIDENIQGVVIDTNVRNFLLDTYTAGAKWADEYPKSLWISVKERLPEDDRVVLCLFGGLIGCPVVRVGQYTDADKIWYIYGWGNPDVTHWMPIPELPTTK